MGSLMVASKGKLRELHKPGSLSAKEETGFILLRTRRSGAGCSRADRAVRVATHSAMVYVCLLYAGKFLQKQQPYAAMTSESRPLESPSIPKQPARELPKF